MSTTAGFGVSDSLRGIFAGLMQTEGRFGPKYLNRDILKVQQYICCRNYSKATLELVYLCWAIVNACPARRNMGKLEAFFWLDEAHTPARFRAAFSQQWQTSAGQVALHNDNLNIVVGSSVFNISPARVGVLAVLMEFIVTLDPGLLSELQQSLANATQQHIDQLARLLQQRVYQYLKHHLPEAPIQTRYRYFEQWLAQQDLSPETLSDDDILLFWQQAQADKQAQSYVLYSTALFDALDAIDAMKIVASQQAVHYAASLGHLSEQGEIDPQQLIASHWDEQFGELVNTLTFSEAKAPASLKSLCNSPKCLTLQEAEWLQPLIDYSAYTLRYLRSFMRLQVFSRWQAVLVQAKRKSASVVAEKLHDVPAQGYAMYQLEINGLQQAIHYSQDCLVAVLLQLEPQFACAELLQQLPASEMQNIAGLLAETGPDASWHSSVKRLRLQFPAFRQLCEQAESACKKNNKAGFKSLTNSENAEPYIEAFELLSTTAKLCQAHGAALEELSHGPGGLSAIFASDVCIFSDRFNILYGVYDAK